MIGRRLACAALAAAGVLLGGCAGDTPDHSADDDVTTLLYASPYSPNHPFSRADRAWIDWVESRPDATLRIRPIWSGALLSADQSLLELRHGVADIGLITPIYVKGGAHLIRTQSGFYGGARTIEQQVDVYRCLAAAFPQYQAELAGLKVLAVQGGSLPGVITREAPIRTLEDLQGLRLRAPTELLGVLRRLGADPVEMTMGEVYSALAKGVIDGVVAPADTFASLHFAEVAGHYTRLEVPRGAYPARAISVEKWRSLPESARQVLEASIAVWEAALAREITSALAAGERTAREAGVEFHDVEPAEQRRFDELYAEDAARNARELSRYDIAGGPVYRAARRITSDIEAHGHVTCTEEDHAPAS